MINNKNGKKVQNIKTEDNLTIKTANRKVCFVIWSLGMKPMHIEII